MSCVVIPAQMRASATKLRFLSKIQFELSYPLRCGLLQPCLLGFRGKINSCHTRSDAGFCNLDIDKCYVRQLSCHTRSDAGFCNGVILFITLTHQSCHTRSDAGFCNLAGDRRLLRAAVVIPAQMRASATTYCKCDLIDGELSYPLRCGLLKPLQMLEEYPASSCHTRSDAGFCNHGGITFSGSLKVVIPAQMRASATFFLCFTIHGARLSYPLRCGLLQHSNEEIAMLFRISCHTRSDAGFCNKDNRQCGNR